MFKPFSLEIKTEGEARVLWHRLNMSPVAFDKHYSEGTSGNYPQGVSSTLWYRIDDILKSMGVNPSKKQGDPLEINGNVVEFRGGGVQVGCTFVDKETVLKIADKLEQMTQEEDEIPF